MPVSQIVYSEKYSDDKFEYRLVIFCMQQNIVAVHLTGGMVPPHEKYLFC